MSFFSKLVGGGGGNSGSQSSSSRGPPSAADQAFARYAAAAEGARGGVGGGATGSAGQGAGFSPIEDHSLAIAHLRKLFADVKANASRMGPGEQASRLYVMLPVFCKVYSSLPSSEMSASFPDVGQFCSHASKLMVTEIKKRASNQSTVNASAAIVDFLEADALDESKSGGWMLLTTLNLLATGGKNLIEAMTACSLPSTLVKCLYLFFDLPPLPEATACSQQQQLTPCEQRALLQRTFTQLLVRLCSHTEPAEELVQKNDLSLLFGAVCSPCANHNVIWRKAAADVLTTLSRYGLTYTVRQYIHKEACIKQCVNGIMKAAGSPLDTVEMLVTICCFLKDASETNQNLLDDFWHANGYQRITQIILNLEEMDVQDWETATDNLICLAASLATCGCVQLKPSDTVANSICQIPNFTVPQPAGKGLSIRNIRAFHVLEEVFTKARTSKLCTSVLTAIFNIYKQDHANFFILDSQRTLSHLIERLYVREPSVQRQCLEILEFVVFQLRYVPMNELSSITKLIKTCNSARCKIIALQSLLKIAKCHEVLKDAYREVGLLDLLVACLHAYAHQLKESSELLVQHQPTASRACTNMLAEQRELGALVMQLLAFLLTTSVKNASVFRDAGGARCAHNMVPHDECRTDILGVVQQLVLSTASEDDMGCLLGLMHTAPPTAIRLKTEVLATISAVLQASHRCRSAFRRCSGFVYVISLLVSLEGSLKEQPGPPWDTADSSAVVLLLKTIFVTLTVAMKFEPANARFFKYEIRYDSLTEAVRLLGCFGPHADALPVPTASAAAGAEAGASSGSSSQPPTPDPSSSTPGSLRFDRVFQSAPVDEALVADYCSDLPQRLRCASFMLKCLFELGVESLEFGIDGGRGGVGSESDNAVMVASPEHSRHRKHLHNLTNQSPPPPAIVHPGAVLSFLQLIPAVVIGDEQTQPELDLQVSALNLLRSLMALARNVQTMCSFGMTQHLLRHYRHCLTDESHHLQPCIQSLFERLASHALSPNDLREFLRLGDPLCCRPLNEIAPSDTAALSEADVPAELPVVGHGGSVPLSRVKCLVSMATPRDARVPFSEPPPPFVELDMSAEGFACLYMPSLAPQAPPASSISPMAAGEAAASTLGGVGSGCDRLFPPPAGLTYMCWLSVQKTDGAVGGHPFRLFTVVRSIQSREDQLACLRVELDPTARQLTVSTAEAELGASPSAAHSSSSADAVFSVPQLSEPDTWHHLALVLNRSGMMKHSAVKLFIDAQLLGNQKLNYISPNVGTVSGTFGGVGGGGGGGAGGGGSGGGSGAPISVASVCAYVGTPCLDSMRKLAPTAWFQGPLFLVEEPLSNQMIETVYKLGASYIGNFQSIRPDMECLFSEERIALSVFANSENVLTVSRIRKLFNRADAKSIAKLLVTAVNDNCTPIRLLPNAAVHLNGPARSMGAVLLGYQGIRSFSPQPVTAVLDCVGCTTVLLGLVSMATDADCLYAAVKALVCALRSSREAQKEMVRTNGFALLGMLLKRKRPLLNSRIQSYAFTLAGLGGVGVVGRSNSESGGSGGSSQLANQSSAGSTSSSTGEAWERNQQDALRYLVCDLRNWRSEASLEPVRTLLDGLTDLANESAGAKQSMLALDLVFRLLHFLVTAPNASPDLLDSLKLLVVNLLRPAPRPNDLLTLGQFLAVSPKYAMSFGLQVMIHLVSGNQKMSEAVSRILGFDWTFVFLQRGLPSDIVIQAFRLLLLLLVQPPGAVARFRDGQCARGWLAGVSAMRRPPLGKLPPANQCVARGTLLSLVEPACQPVPGGGKRPDLCPEAAQLLLSMVRCLLSLSEPDYSQRDCRDWPASIIEALNYLYIHHPDFPSLQQQQQQQSPPPPQSPLVTHPNVGRVIDFLRLIITDSFAFSLNSHSRGGSGGQPLIDVLLEACPDASPAAREKYQSLLLHSIIDHMLAFDILRAEEMSFPLNSGGSYACLAHNACYFAARVVDKLCAGLFANDSNEVYQFVRRLIRQAEQSPPPGGLDPLYNCLNRVLLYQLSRNIEDEREHPAVLEALNCLLRDAATILSPKNTSETFPSCLAYLLLTIVRGLPPVADSCQSSNWHVSSFHLQGQAPPTYAAVVVAAHKAWEELYLRRKVELQDSLRQPLNAPGTMTAPQLSGLNDLVYVAAKSRWVAYREAESSSVTVYRPLEKIHQQIRSNLSRMGSGMLRQLTQTASGQRRSRRDTGEGGGGGSSGGGGLPMSTSSGSGSGDFLSDHHHHHHHRSSSDAFDPSEAACLLKEQLASVKELVDQRCLQYEQTASLVQRYLEDEWASLEEELTRERGIWGPPRGFATEKWMLDATEGPLRMRKRLTPNPAFFQHYPFRSKSDSQRPAPRYRTPVSRDALLHVYSYRPKRLLIDQTLRLPAVQPDEVTEEGFVELSAEISAETTACINTIRRNTGASIDVEAAAAAAAADDTASSVPASDAPEPEGSSGAGSTAATAGSAAAAASASGAGRDEESPMDSHAAIQHLLSGEKITQMFRCARVQGLDVHEGLLLLGKDYFYVVDGFTLFKTKEIVDIDAVPHHEPIIPSAPAGPQTNPAGHKREHFKFAYEDLREIHRRRYLLQPIALELFSSDGRTLLLVFRKRTMSKVYQKLEQMAPALSELSQQHQRSAEQNASASFITALMGEKSFTQRWERGEISNFQYLILLNTLAGRSYNDLMQYPIFPWILADYDSSELDLGNPDTFRDLTKPMGAQTEDRLTQFHKRFKEWDDPSGETPPYHYGTHYSSAMIVSSYLVRMEPFTQHFLKLQGGHFDLADRMFHSIREAWLSASKYNMADVKELIPEFFYLPQFLVNHNKFDLGTKQSGVSLNDVVLPPWAKDDSREFIRAHREALECDYVSSQLHNWIDLIFGYKQLGPSAVQSVNVFHHLFYEGNVDIDGIDDELKRTAVIGFINNFGQIPKQLFRKPHPARRLAIPRAPSGAAADPLQPSTSLADRLFYHHLDTLRPSMTPTRELKEAVGEILATDRSVAALPTNQCFVMPQGLRYLSWGHADNSLRLGVVDSDRIVATFEGVESVGCILCAVAPSDRMFVTGGTSTVVRVWQQFGRRLRLKAALYGHTEPVTCLAVSIAYSVIVSGSRDQSAIVWDLSRLCFVRQLAGHPAPVAAVAINESSGDIATAAGTHLHLWSVNGEPLASINTTSGRAQQIHCLAMSCLHDWDPMNVVLTAGADGVVRMWTLEYVQTPVADQVSAGEAGSSTAAAAAVQQSRQPPPNSPTDDQWVGRSGEPAGVTSLSISRDHRAVYIGDARGRVWTWSVPAEPLRGGLADNWIKDEGVAACAECGVKFSPTVRRHHCRNCGRVFCNRCSRHEIEIKRLRLMKPVRVCNACYAGLRTA
uniref:WD repeat and FYVE domain-containing protein 3 n=1 Tax=Macrostomum lignano TaxID=282301 RepID=A0A1I8G3P8_9PLAT